LAPQLGQEQLRVHRSDEVPQGLGTCRDDLHGALDVRFSGETIEQDPDLLGDQRLEGLAVERIGPSPSVRRPTGDRPPSGLDEEEQPGRGRHRTAGQR
jgi:hypothetical protein